MPLSEYVYLIPNQHITSKLDWKKNVEILVYLTFNVETCIDLHQIHTAELLFDVRRKMTCFFFLSFLMKHGFQTQTGYAKCDPVPHPSQPLPTPSDLPASLLVKGFWLFTNCNKQQRNWESDQWEQRKRVKSVILSVLKRAVRFSGI